MPLTATAQAGIPQNSRKPPKCHTRFHCDEATENPIWCGCSTTLMQNVDSRNRKVWPIGPARRNSAGCECRPHHLVSALIGALPSSDQYPLVLCLCQPLDEKVLQGSMSYRIFADLPDRHSLEFQNFRYLHNAFSDRTADEQSRSI